jgi:hypothetical protein
MSTTSLRKFIDRAGKHGFPGAGGHRTRPLLAAVAAGAATLATVGALALVAPGGGAAAASRPVPATRVLHALKLTGEGNNWAGYVIQPGQDVDYVSGEWTIPTLSCTQATTIDSVWAGIGGVGQALLQTGVSDACINGQQQDWAWWELANARNPATFNNLIVGEGDVMQASVYYQSGQWITRIDDLTTGFSGWMHSDGSYGVERDAGGYFSNDGSSNVLFAGGDTVEWVVEGPGLAYAGQNFTQLSDFGTVQFFGLRAGLPSWSLTPDESEQITFNNQPVATPGQPDGDGFSVSE